MADVTDATFEADVIERSKEVPVIVDLWAEWCGPCRTLGPIIEKVVAETDGKVELAKVDVDANPQVSAAFRVQSIPAVYALQDGKVVDGFMGALPEHQVREFVARFAPAETEADRLTALGDEASLRQALTLEPGHEPATIALAELLVGKGEGDKALEVLAKIPESAESRRVAALARVGGSDSVPVGDDIEARLDALLERAKDDEAARQEFLDLLEVMGAEDSRTMQYRRALTMRLY
jgi:putative thioredoxin